MNAEQAVHHILANASAYNTHVGGSAAAARIYYDEAEQGAAFPNAVVTAESIDTTDTKDGSDFDHDLVQVFHSAPTKAVANAMAKAARTALTATVPATYNGISVREIRLVDQDSFTERLVNNKVYTVEQIYKVTADV